MLTPSFAAISYTPKLGSYYSEDDRTDPDTPGLPPYPRSKAIAERAAWDFITREGAGMEVVAVNPTFILGPTLTTPAGSSLQTTKAMLDGLMPVVGKQRFAVADVRDVVDLHIRAIAPPAARQAVSLPGRRAYDQLAEDGPDPAREARVRGRNKSRPKKPPGLSPRT